MSATIDDKKLNGAGLATLWGIIKQYIVDNPSIPKATASTLGCIMVGTTLGVNSSGVLNLASGVVTAGTYKSVTVDTYGRVTAGANPNTLAGYGITDAKISNGSIILGENSITPITSLSGYATQTWVQQQGYLTEETYKGTVTQVKVGTTAYDPTSGVVSLPAYPTTLPASDVYSWAKAASKPSYTASEVGAATSGHTHTTSLASDSGTSTITLASAGKYKLTAGGTSVIFTMPTIPTVSYPVTSVNSKTGAVTLTASDVGAATSGHTHTTSIATSTGTNQITLAHGGKYAITAGGTSYIFTMPSDNNTTYSAGTGLSLSGTTFSLATSGVTAGTYKRVTVDAYGRVTSGDNTDANDNTWRNIYTGGTSRVGTGTDTKAINFVAGSNVSISYEAAGTGDGQSGSANYFNVKIAATDTTYSAATQSAAGLMSAADKKKLDGIASGANAYSLPTASSSTLGGVKVGTTLSISSSVLNLATSGVTAGTYKRVTVDSYGRVTSGDNTDADTNTWRGIYVKGTSSIGTGTDTKALNFAAGSNVSISFAAAGTGSGQSGNANYGTITISATDTTYSAATQSAAGLMSAADKKKLDGIAAGANAYSLPTASSSALGGIKVGASVSGKNYAVQLDSSNCAYVNVPWENTTYTIPTKVSQLTNDSGYITSYTNTWRNVYLAGTEKVGTGTGTKGLNFVAGSNITITYEAAGTSSGQSGNANYFNIKIAATDTNTWRPLGTGASDACAGNDSRLSNSRPASDVYSWAKASTKPSYAFNEITAGAATIGDGANYVRFRTNTSYESGIYYSTPGNEAMVFANKYNVTSWIFANTSPSGRADWTSLTPAMQIKKNCVYINSLIASGTDPSYNLYVNGSMYVTSINGVNVGTSPKFTDTTYTFTNKGATLAWSTTSTIATVGGVDIKVTMPANPNTDHYAWSDITGKPSTYAPSAHSHNYVVGSYTSNGGQQKPNYFGTNKVGFLMMNTTVNSNSQYKDWIIMDCYNGNDVGGGVAFGVNRQALGAYIMRSAAERTAWAESAELLGTHNYDSYAAKKTEAIKSISRSGTTFTATRCDGTTFTFTQQDNNTTYTLAGLMGSTAIGGTTQPIYWNGSAFKNTTYTLGKSVPSDAKFTDTNTWRPLGTGASDAAAGNHTHTLSIAADTGTNAITLAHGTKYKLTAGGSTLIFTMPTDNNTTYSAATQSANGLMSAADKKKLDGIASGANAYSLPTASSSALGGIKVGASVSGKNYAVQLDSSNCAYVNVPWTDNNTTYTQASLGQVYAYSTPPTSGTAVTATNSDYVLATGGILAVQFDTNPVPASATLNVNSKGAKNIKFKKAALAAGVIKAGDLATFMYDGTQYELLTVDRTMKAVTGISRSGTTFTATCVDGSTFTFTQQDNNTTYTLAGLMGSSAIGGTTQPIYWNGSAFKNTTYTLGKSVPSDAKFTDTTYTFTNKGATLAWSTTSTIATVGGVDIKVTMPANPNTDHYAWTDITGKPNIFFSNNLFIGDNYINGTKYTALDNGVYTHTKSQDSETLLHFQNAGASASGLDILFTYGQSSSEPLKYRKNIDNARFADAAWVSIIDSLNISSQSVNSATYATYDSGGYTIANTTWVGNNYLPLSGGTLTGDLNSNYDVNCNVMRMNNIYCADKVKCLSLTSNVITSEKIGNGTYNKMYWSLYSDHYEFEFPNTDDTHGVHIPIYMGWRGGVYALTLAANTNVGVGTTSPSYKLHVNGACAATSFPNISDIRKKNIVKDNLSIGLNAIANAPLFDFTWKDVSLDKDLHIGSSAQYWKNVIPEAVTVAQDEMCTLSMQYDVIAFASIVSVAKETLTLKEKVALLETRVESLEKKIREYELN